MFGPASSVCGWPHVYCCCNKFRPGQSLLGEPARAAVLHVRLEDLFCIICFSAYNRIFLLIMWFTILRLQ